MESFIKLVPDWKRVLLLSMSFWAQVIGLLVLIVPEILIASTGRDIDPYLLWWVGVLLLVFGLVGRLFQQSSSVWMEWARIFAVLVIIFLVAVFASSQAYAHECECSQRESADALDIAVPLIGKWEGLRTQAYLDIVGVPTICYGSTRGVSLGMVKTKAECDALLREEVAEYRDGWLDYVTDEAQDRWLPAKRDAAYTSLAYNVGIRAAGRSTATRRLNAGNIRGGCTAIGWWNRAGNRVIRGLVNRRTEETELCMDGVVS